MVLIQRKVNGAKRASTIKIDFINDVRLFLNNFILLQQIKIGTFIHKNIQNGFKLKWQKCLGLW